MSHAEHIRAAESIVARCAVITLSDTRTLDTDTSGKSIIDLLTAAGHVVARRELLRDDPAPLGKLLESLLNDESIEVVLTTGGTGISRRDQAVEVVARAIEQELAGFGELFRMLSWHEIGAGAMLSRAVGGVARGKLLFAMPGSTAAVELAMGKLILPELKHLLRELRKG